MSDDHRTPAELWHRSGGDDIAAGVATVEEVLNHAGELAENLEPGRKRQFAQFALNSLENTPDAIDLVKAAFPGVDLPDNGQPEAGLLDIADLGNWPAEPLQPIVPGVLARGQLVNLAGPTQVRKSLMELLLAWKMVTGGKLFGKFEVQPVQRVLCLILEDPPRRVRARLEDMAGEFDGLPEPGRLQFDFREFRLYDPDARDEQSYYHGLDELEARITQEQLDLVFIDTFQRATPGIESFNDLHQSRIWHGLAKIMRRTDATIVTLDHFRKQPAGARKGSSAGLDEVKGSGTKLQNCDGVILLERKDKNQLKLWAMNKDFDDQVGILLEVSGIGQGGPKFTYVEDLNQVAMKQKEIGQQNRQKVLDAMPIGEPLSAPEIAQKVGLSDSATKGHLNALFEKDRVDTQGEHSHKKWWCIS